LFSRSAWLSYSSTISMQICIVSPNVDGVTKRSVIQDVQRDYGDALPSSEMRYTHLEACGEESVNDKRPIMLWTHYFLLETG